MAEYKFNGVQSVKSGDEIIFEKEQTMCDDLIKREDAIEAVSISCGICIARNIEDCEKCSVPKLIESINAIPSADRPQGEWGYIE